MIKLSVKIADVTLEVELKSTKLAKDIRDQLKKQGHETKLVSEKVID